MFRADLHIHSTVSDGSHTIGRIFEDAQKAGLTHVSITDHDTTEGVRKALHLGEETGIVVIPGVEFSAYDYINRIRTHILGYGMKDFAPIEQLGSELLGRRHTNSLRQIEVLRKLGYQIMPEEVAAKAGRHIYKQHIMHVLVEKGYAREIIGDTYMKLFKFNGPCDFDIDYIDARDAIRTIKQAGGIAVLAHPGQQGNYSSLSMLIHAGLDGLELNHHSNTSDDHLHIMSIAQAYGLLVTGGSDCHGIYEANSPAVGSWICPPRTIHQMKEMNLAC